MPPPSSLGDDLSDDDDVSLETGPAAAAATGKPPARPPPKPVALPIKTTVEAPKGIPQDLAALFTFDKPRASSKPDVKAHIAKVLGKRRASVIASNAKEPEEGDGEPKKGGEKLGDASGSDSDGSPVVLSKQMQRLVDDEKADEKRQRRLRVASEEAKKIQEEERRALASITEAMAARQEEAETVKDEVRAKAEEAAAAIGPADADDTPYPSAFVRALDDHAFGSAAVERLAPRCPAPTPGTLKPFENAARRRVAKAGGSAGDADAAVAEALREALEGGFLAAAFAAEVDSALGLERARAMMPATPGADGATDDDASRTMGTRTIGSAAETKGKSETRDDSRARIPACDAETARWLFDAATRPESSKSVALGARDALLAAAGYEPIGLDARHPPRRRRGVFALPVARNPKTSKAAESRLGDGEASRREIAFRREIDARAPALAWAPTAGEVLEALRRLGVRALDVGEPIESSLPASSVPSGENAGAATKASAATRRTKRNAFPTKASRLPGEQRKSASLNALAEDMSLSKSISKKESKEGSFPMSGRSAADTRDAAALMRPPPGALKPQVFAAAQLLAAWCARDGDGGRPARLSIASDPADAASLLAALAALRLDPRAAALAHVADDAAAALLAAASRTADEETWAAFERAAARAVARVGATHASRLAATRWVPWSSAREQRVQDAAALVALTDIQAVLAPHVKRALANARASPPLPRGDPGDFSLKTGHKKGKRGKVEDARGEVYSAKASVPNRQNADAVDVQSAATATLGGVVVDGHTTAEEAWALVSAIHHVDVVLHAGMAEPKRSGTETETETENVAQRSFMSFLKDVKAKVPRSNKAGLQALKTLAVATYTRHQRAQQLRESKSDR